MATEWKYMSIVSECIQILVTIGLGCILGYLRIFEAKSLLPQTTKFCYNLALPSLVVSGLGISINIYEDLYLWNYVGAFVLLRFVTLVACILLVVVFGTSPSSMSSTGKISAVGQVAVYWLSCMFLATFTLGVPIAGAVLGDDFAGLEYAVLTGVSTFIFQLPLELFLFECNSTLVEQQQNESFTATADNTKHIKDDDGSILDDIDLEACCEGEKEIDNRREADKSVSDDEDKQNDGEEKSNSTISRTAGINMGKEKIDNKREEDKCVSDGDDKQNDGQEKSNSTISRTAGINSNSGDGHQSPTAKSAPTLLQLLRRGSIWKKIILQMSKNPLLWSIVLGFTLTLSTVGPRYLNPESADYVTGLGWVFSTLQWFGDCLSPVSFFAMGVWMQKNWRTLFGIPVWSAMLYMVAKLIAIPLLMTGIAVAVGLDDQAGRAAICIAALPITLASFTLGSRYKTGEAVLAENIALGTILLLPTVLIWNIALDAVGLFPVSSI